MSSATAQQVGRNASEWTAWEELVAAAQREGEILIALHTAELRNSVGDVFAERFGLQSKYTSSLVSRVAAERASGKYVPDIFIAGQLSFYTGAYQLGFFDPMAPAFVHPEVIDASSWSCVGCSKPADTPYPFMDPKGDTILRLTNGCGIGVAYNTKLVRPGELTSYQDLLDPKWKGKIIAGDPTASGGNVLATFWWRALGDDFIRRFYQEQLAPSPQGPRKIPAGLANGTYAIVQQMSVDTIEKLREEGAPVDFVRRMNGAPAEYADWVWGSGYLVGLMNRAPHPNAAKLFVNWLCTREGAEAYGRALTMPVARTDVAHDWVPDYLIPKPGVSYFDVSGWEYAHAAQQPEVQAKLRDLVGRS